MLALDGLLTVDVRCTTSFWLLSAEIAVLELNKPDVLFRIVGNMDAFKISTYFGKVGCAAGGLGLVFVLCTNGRVLWHRVHELRRMN